MQHAVTLNDAELVARTDAPHVRICAEQRDQLRDFVHIDVRRIWERDGARDMPAQGAAIAKAVQRLADQIPELSDDERPADSIVFESDVVDQRRADALYLIASAYGEKDADDDRAAVVVHKRLPDPADTEGWTELDRGVTLDPESRATHQL